MNGYGNKLVKVRKLRSSNHFGVSTMEEEFKWNIKDFIELIRNYIRSPAFAGLLTVKMVITLGQVCRSFRNLFDQNYVKMVVCMGNLNTCLRFKFWCKNTSLDE